MPATFPSTIRPSIQRFFLRGNTQIFRSPLDGSIQALEQGGARWIATLTFDRHKRAEIAELEAFLDELLGSSGDFLLWDHARENPRGTAPGTPLVGGAGQTGKSVATFGWTASQNGILLKGDLIEFGGELKRVTADVNSDASGIATIPIVPPIRVSPADNAVVTTVKPMGTFKLIDDNQVQLSRDGPLTSVTFTSMESF